MIPVLERYVTLLYVTVILRVGVQVTYEEMHLHSKGATLRPFVLRQPASYTNMHYLPHITEHLNIQITGVYAFVTFGRNRKVLVC